MAFRSELTNTFVGARLGQSRLFVRGGRFRRLLPGENYSYLGRTDITPPQITRGDKTTFEMPSDTDGTTTILVEAAPGSHETNTGTITQRLEATMGEGWWDAIRDNAPVTMFIPAGRVRQLDDIDDWESGWLVDNVYLKNLGPDNNANPADRATVGEAFNLTGEFEYESYAVHRVLPVSFSSEMLTGANNVNAVGYRRGADGINFVAGTSNTTATTGGTGSGADVTAAAGKLFASDIYGKWGAGVDLPDAANSADEIIVLGSNVVALDTTGLRHYVAKVDDLVTGSASISQITGYTTAKGPRAIYAPSSGNMTIVGAGGAIYRAAGIRSNVTLVDGTTTSNDLNDVHGMGEQMVAVGASATIVVSDNFGDSWTSVTPQVDGTNLTTGNFTAVHMVAKDAFLIAHTPATIGPNAPVTLYYTRDFGKTLTACSIVGATLNAAGASINDIQLVMNETGLSAIGYMAITNGGTTTSGAIARTLDGGFNWSVSEPYADVEGTSLAVNSVAAIDANRAIAGVYVAAEQLKGTVDTNSDAVAPVGQVFATSQASA